MGNPKNKMQKIARMVENQLPQDYGFVVLAYSHSELGEMLYASNSNRQDVVKAMEEFIEKTKNNYANEIMVHGAMTYQCEKCGKKWRMWLEVGVEGKDKIMPCPFTIRCKCGGWANHVDWNHDTYLPEPQPLGENMSYFKLDRQALERKDETACGIPIIKG